MSETEGQPKPTLETLLNSIQGTIGTSSGRQEDRDESATKSRSQNNLHLMPAEPT